MKYLFILCVPCSILLTSCGGVDGHEPIDEVVFPEYTILVKSSHDTTSQAYSYALTGESADWRPDIGHMELGPDGSSCDLPTGALWATFNPTAIDFENGTVDTTVAPILSFYSILYPCNDLGDQESNWYDATDYRSALELGIDREGKEFIRGVINLTMTRQILNMEDVPEDIEVQALFTATNR